MKKTAIFLMILFALLVQPSVVSAQAPLPDGFSDTPAPSPTSPAQPVSTPQPTTITHKVLFPAETLSKYLEGAVLSMNAKSIEDISDSKSAMIAALENVLIGQKPNYGEISRRSLPFAGVLAVLFFLLRVVLYNWAKLSNENDSILSIFGDILAASAFAVLSGELIDLLNQFLFLAIPAMIGDIPSLINSLVDFNLGGRVATSMISSIIALGIAIGMLIAITAFVFGVLGAMIAFYVLAALFPVLSVVSVLPQTRWLKALAIKYMVLISLLPLISGLVIRSYAELSSSALMGGGIIESLLRLFWALGASGIMLSIAGIIGKFTIGQTVDAGKKAVAAVGAIAAMASGVGALAAPAAASAAIPASGAISAGSMQAASAASGVAGGGAASSGSTGAVSAVSSGPPPSPLTPADNYRAYQGAYASLESSAHYAQKAAAANLFGFRSLANVYSARSRLEELNARQNLVSKDVINHRHKAFSDAFMQEASERIPALDANTNLLDAYMHYNGPNRENYLSSLQTFANVLDEHGLDSKDLNRYVNNYSFNDFMSHIVQQPNNQDIQFYQDAAEKANFNELSNFLSGAQTSYFTEQDF